MATASPTKLLTAEEFMAAELGEGKHELVRGEIVEISPPPMLEHGRVQLNVGFVLELFGRHSGFGYCATESGVLTQRARYRTWAGCEFLQPRAAGRAPRLATRCRRCPRTSQLR